MARSVSQSGDGEREEIEMEGSERGFGEVFEIGSR